MKKVWFALVIVFFTISCEKTLPIINKDSIGDLSGLKILAFNENLNLESFSQISRTYAKEDVLPEFQLSIRRSALNKINSSLNNWPMIKMSLSENQLKGSILFPQIKSLKEISIAYDKIQVLKFANTMPNLIIIELIGLEQIQELPNIEICPNIEVLDMYDSKLQNISEGPIVPSLKKLRLHGTFLNMQAVKRFPNLEWLSLNNSNIRVVEGLDTLSKLQKVNLSNNVLLEDLDGLLKSPLCDEVILVGVPFNPNFLDTFKQMPKLIALDLSNAGISDLRFLSDLPKNIQYIGLMNNKIEIVSNLEACPNIIWDYTTFRGNPVKKITRASLDLIIKQQGDAENINNGETFLYEINAGNITVIEN